MLSYIQTSYKYGSSIKLEKKKKKQLYSQRSIKFIKNASERSKRQQIAPKATILL